MQPRTYSRPFQVDSVSILFEASADILVFTNSLIDLCSFIVCHRFFSAGWFHHLAKHVSTELDADAFERVVMLEVSDYSHIS
jgi:hypothetical protein